MANDRKERWMNWLALSTVIFAVCATLSTFKGGGYSTRSLLAQSQASDRWAHFQSKSIKGYLYELQKDSLELELGSRPDLAGEGRAGYEKRVAEYGGKITEYRNEKTAIEKEARELEASRDAAQQHSAAFGFAVIFLQIAILLSSIAALVKRQPVYWLGLAIGAVGIVAFANGFLLFYAV